MENKPLLLLLGDSVLMDGIAVTLARSSSLRCVRLDTNIIGLSRQIELLSPDLIVFELDTPQSESIISLLSSRPGTLLLGVDLSSSRVIVMNSHQHVTGSMQELYHVFETEVDYAAGFTKRRCD